MAEFRMSVSRLREALASGETCTSIAARSGCSIATVSRRAKQVGVVLSTKGRPCEIDRADVLRRRASGATYREIAATLNVSTVAVWKIVTKEVAR